jgi:putative membrane protein
MPVTNVGGRLANYGVVFTNQIRNLLIGGLNYGPHDSAWREALVKWAIAFAFATKESLRNGNNLTPLVGVLTEQELVELKSAIHMPLFVINKIATLLQKARTGYPNTNGLELDGFEFSMLEGQRSLLIDHLGCRERILKTPMPFVYAVKIRRFVFMFLLLIPFSLLEKRVFILSLFFFWSLTPCYHWTVLVLSCKSHLIVKA